MAGGKRRRKKRNPNNGDGGGATVAMAPAPPPKVLSSIYGHSLATLYELVSGLLQLRRHPPQTAPQSILGRDDGGEEEEEEKKLLIREGDPAPYIALLHCSYAALEQNEPLLAFRSLDDARWSLNQVIERVIEKQYRQRGKLSNVLCLGYSQRYQGSTPLRNFKKVASSEHASHHNFAVAAINSQVWEILHSRVGDSFMVYLLSNAAVFYPLPNNCYLQVSGRPIYLSSPAGQIVKTVCHLRDKSGKKSVKLNEYPLSTNADATERKVELPKPLNEVATVDAFGAIGEENRHQKCRMKQNALKDSHNCTQMAERRFLMPVAYAVDKRTKFACSQERKSNGILEHCCESKQSCAHVSLNDIRKSQIDLNQTDVNMEGDSISFPLQTDEPRKKRFRPFSWQRRRVLKQSIEVTGMLKTQIHHGESNLWTRENKEEESICQIPPSASVAFNCSSRKRKISGDGSLWQSKRCEYEPKSSQLLVEDLPNVVMGFGFGKNYGRGDHVNDADIPRTKGTLECHRAPPEQNKKHKPSCGVAANTRFIDRRTLFYRSKFSRYPKLPKNPIDILNKLCASEADAIHLFQRIFKTAHGFDPCSLSCTLRALNSGDMMRDKCGSTIINMLQKIISNSKKCQYGRLLDRHCPLPETRKLSQLKLVAESLRCKSKLAVGCLSKDFDLSHEEGYATQEEEGIGKLKTTGIDGDGDGSRRSENVVGNSCLPNFFVKPHQDAINTQSLNAGSESLANTSNTDGQPINKTRRKRKLSGRGDMQGEFSVYSSSYSQVVSFIWAVCRRVIHEDLLGGRENWRALRRNIYRFVELRRHEKFTLEQCLHKLKLSEFPWLRRRELATCKGSGCLQNLKLEKGGKSRGVQSSQYLIGDSLTCCLNQTQTWVFWLFSDFIVPLMQAHFYVTESEHSRQNVFYYRKPLWAKLSDNTIKNCTKKKYKKLKAHAVATILTKRPFGFSHVRLLPKKTGARLIANLGAPCVFSSPTRSLLEKPRMSLQDKGKSIISDTRKRGIKIDHFQRSENFNLDYKVPRRDLQLKNGAQCARFKSVNSNLLDLHQCLKYEQYNHPENIGCSVYDYNDIYKHLLPFVSSLKSSSSGAPPLYFAICDVERAFDSINQERLCKIVQDFLQEDEYVILRFRSSTVNTGAVKFRYERFATSVAKYRNHLRALFEATTRRSNTIFVDQACSSGACERNWSSYSLIHTKIRNRLKTTQLEKLVYCRANLRLLRKLKTLAGPMQASTTRLLRKTIIAMLEEHIKRNILKMERGFFVQVEGIAQGSSISSILCSLYYADLEHHKLSTLSHRQSTERFLTKDEKGKMGQMSNAMYRNSLNHESVPRQILLRLVDDWLFVSSSESRATDFVQRMHKGFRDYNCFTNRDKTAVSFDVKLDNCTLKLNIYRSEDGACFMRWGGLFINSHTLEIQADYTRYCGQNIKSTLTVWRQCKQGTNLLQKMHHFMRPKCHPLFYDSNINSPGTVRLNAYQAFLVCAMKFHVYCCSLTSVTRNNSNFLFKCIVSTTRYMYMLIVGRTKKNARNSAISPLFFMGRTEVDFLGLYAFHKVLTRKQSRYTLVLSLIQAELQKKEFQALFNSPHIVTAIDDRRSSMFKYINY